MCYRRDHPTSRIQRQIGLGPSSPRAPGLVRRTHKQSHRGKGEDELWRQSWGRKSRKKGQNRTAAQCGLESWRNAFGGKSKTRGRRNGLGGSSPSCACRRTQPRGFRTRRGITLLPYEMHTSTSLPEPGVHRECFQWNGCPSTFLVFEINPFIPLPTTVFAPLDVR